MAAFLRVLPTRWRHVSFACKMAAFLSFTHKMVVWEFCLEDGSVCEFFTHKMAACEFCPKDGVFESFTQKMSAWEICLQDGGNTRF